MFTLLLLPIISLSFVSIGLPDSLLGSAWPSMYSFLKVPLHYAGFISMIITGGSVISSIFSEKVIRRFGTGIVTAVSVLMTATALLAFSFSGSFLLLCLCAVLLGLGAGFFVTALNNYVALNFKARYMSWMHCFGGVGAAAGPLIMSYFLDRHNSWNLGYRAVGIIQLCLAAILFVSLPLWKNSRSAEPQNRSPVKFTQLLQIAGAKEALLAFFSYCTIELTTGLWGASFLVIEKGIPAQTAAQWIALYYVGITVGRFASGFVTMKLNNRQMIRLGQITIGIGVIVLFLPLGNITLLPWLLLVGLGCAPIFPSLVHETPKNFGEEYSQAIMGLQVGSAYIGIMLMPPLFGRIASYTGFTIFPIFTGLVLIANIVLVEVLNRKVRQAKPVA
jgi:fucose permease